MKAGLFQRRPQSGFTLIEMLIALVIFVIALLAIGLLQLRGIAMTRDANMRTTAIFAARSLGEAIKANYMASYTHIASNTAPAAPTRCAVTLGRNISSLGPCICDRRTADISDAYTLASNLPNPATGGKIAVTALPLRAGSPTIPTSFLAPADCASLEGQAYQVTVRWSEGTGAIGINDQSVQVVVMP
jgi:type IV pilus modification protein PilV